MAPVENALARYVVLHELGRGPGSAVYAARERASGAVVALKRLDPAALQADPELARRFLKQARSAVRLKHRNIAEIRDAFEAAGTAYVAMELLEGDSLRKLLDAGPIPVGRAIRVARDIAGALEHAHLEGVVHGGLDPSDVIVLRSGAAKVTDFGGAPVDHRADLLALGALLYEMLTRRAPEPSHPKPPSEVNAHVPRSLDKLVLGLLAADPNDRPAGAPIVSRDLQRIADELGLDLAPPPAPEPAPQPEPERPQPEPERRPPTIAREAFDYNPAMMIMDRESRAAPPRRSGSRLAVAGFVALLLIVGGGLASLFIYESSELMDRAIAGIRTKLDPPIVPKVAKAPVEPAPAPVAAPAPLPVEPPPAPQPVARPAPPPAPVEEPAPAVPPVAKVEQPVEEPKPAPKPVAAPPIAKVREKQPIPMAKLIVAISPGGDIYVNGEHRGTAPAMTTFELEPGMHRIEVRSGSRKPYLTYMTVQSGETRRIRHDFNAKPSHPRLQVASPR